MVSVSSGWPPCNTHPCRASLLVEDVSDDRPPSVGSLRTSRPGIEQPAAAKEESEVSPGAYDVPVFLKETVCSGEEDNGSEVEPCYVSLEDRLVKTYPIWFLPDLQRTGALHLLQGKEVGNFIVRKSSNPDTMAISVRLPPDKEPHVQHYLIEIHRHHSSTKYSLESSENHFDSPHKLIAYYCLCCDELPVKLKLPQKILDAKTRHELASLALLGQEFWRTAMANPLPSPVDGVPTLSSSPNRHIDISFSSFGKAGISSPLSLLCQPISLQNTSTTSAEVEPSVTKILSPAERSSLNLNLSPHSDCVFEPNLFSSFKSQPGTPITSGKPNPFPRSSPPSTSTKFSITSPSNSQGKIKPSPPIRRSPSYSSPSDDVKLSSYSEKETLPAPPVRLSKTSGVATTSSSNITVTTTLTLNVNQLKPAPGTDENQCLKVGDGEQNCFEVQLSSLEISPAQLMVSDQASSSGRRDKLRLDIRSTAAPQSTPCTPCTPTTPLGTPMSEDGVPKVRMRNSKKDRRRHSNHYHEANIVDSVQCYRSSLADKISDYEDLWSSPPRDSVCTTTTATTDSSPSPKEVDHKMTTFKPRNEISKSLGDLSEISPCNNKAIIFDYEFENNNIPFDKALKIKSSNDSLNSYRKTSSPFYVEPADALKEPERKARINKASIRLSRKMNNRYSDSNIQWRSNRTKHLSKIIDDCELENGQDIHENDRSSMALEEEKNVKNVSEDYLKKHSKSNVWNRLDSKGEIPSTARSPSLNTELPWRLDKSWEFHGVGKVENRMEGKFPVDMRIDDPESVIIPGEKTVQEMISEKLPDLPVGDRSTKKCLTRISEYDNVSTQVNSSKRAQSCSTPTSPLYVEQHSSISRNPSFLSYSSNVSDSGTEFSEPWDSKKWDRIFQNAGFPLRRVDSACIRMADDSDTGHITSTDTESLLHTSHSLLQSDDNSSNGTPACSVVNGNSTTNLHYRILSPQMIALRHRQDAESGATIRSYTIDLGNDASTIFSKAVGHFITCTLESSEKNPIKVIRNIRQFMSGMKNYLVRSGEKEFEATVKKECSHLKATEFLNLDAILEDVLVKLVLRPLWTHVNKLFVENYSQNGSIQTLANNMRHATSQGYFKYGIRLHQNGSSYIDAYGDADDLVPILMWVLSQANFISAEIEADYISGLLLPSSSSEEAEYYLTAFHSAVHALKNLSPSPESSPGNSLDSMKQEISLVSEQSLMKILVPDEKNGSIVTRTLPVKPGMTTKEVCKMMAHKMKVTNPQDFGLYKLVDGQESILADNECPHKVRNDLVKHGFHCLIAYKRMDAKIAWPIITK